MTLDIKALANEVAATGPNMNESQAAPARTLPPEGMANLRFVGYVEVGKHEKPVAGQAPKVEDMVHLVFELSGKNYPVREFEGKKIAERVTIKVNKSLNEKAHFYKLFCRMNYEGKATHMSQLLGNAYRGKIVHGVIKANNNKYLTLRDDTGFTVGPPRAEVLDPESGETSFVTLNVAEPISDLRLFVWDAVPERLKLMWDNIKIEGKDFGEGDQKRSANVFQELIKKAVNFGGSPIQQLIACNGAVADIPDAEPGKPASADPLDDVA